MPSRTTKGASELWRSHSSATSPSRQGKIRLFYLKLSSLAVRERATTLVP